MKNKGFTLMELLAVIVILAIIALIATPIILGIIGATKADANERSIELYAKSIKTAVAKYHMVNNKPLAGNFITTDGKILKQGENIELEVEYNGGSVICNTITITPDGEVNLDSCKVNNTGDYSYINGSVSKNEDAPSGGGTSKVCTLADTNSNDTADVGEMVTCGTGDMAQRFYVMPHHEKAASGTISMLAEYNITTTANPVQDPTDTEWPSKNSVVFSTEEYWDNRDIEFIYDDRASISTYVNAYKSTLVGMGVSEDIVVTLPSYQQLDDSRVGCSDYDDFGMRICTGPSWVYSTSYWLGSGACYKSGFFGATEVWNVSSYYGEFAAANDFSLHSDYGVRPIVIISEDDI